MGSLFHLLVYDCGANSDLDLAPGALSCKTKALARADALSTSS